MSVEKSMAQQSNWEGARIGFGAKSFEEIVEQCVAIVQNGIAVTKIPPKEQRHVYRAAEVPAQ